MDRAKQLAPRGATAPNDAPITVAGALGDYAADLKAHAASVCKNVRWPKTHLTGALLAQPVQLLNAQELKKCRDGVSSAPIALPVSRLTKWTPARTSQVTSSILFKCAAGPPGA